ncbi:MAG: CoA pyrophosphatase [Ramlibacter sp.]
MRAAGAGVVVPAPRQLPADLVPLAALPGFDPLAHAVADPPGALPPVPAAALRADAIRARFAAPPRWHPEPWPIYRFAGRQPAIAAVLVPIVLHAEPAVLLTQRTAHLTTHAGQVAFPGGKKDRDDRDLVHTALREAAEEIGLAAADVEIVGQLPASTTGTGFVLTPVVGLLRPGTAVTAADAEVAEIFELPLAYLLDPRNHSRHQLLADGVLREWMSITCRCDGTERVIWGATAAVLRDLYRFFSA